MKRLIVLCFLIIALPVFAIESPVPDEFIGDWVPANGSCQSKIMLRVEKDSITLLNDSASKKFGNLDLCYSCEGGAQYNGEVVWLIPEFNSGKDAPFTVYFYTEERKGVTVID